MTKNGYCNCSILVHCWNTSKLGYFRYRALHILVLPFLFFYARSLSGIRRGQAAVDLVDLAARSSAFRSRVASGPSAVCTEPFGHAQRRLEFQEVRPSWSVLYRDNMLSIVLYSDQLVWVFPTIRRPGYILYRSTIASSLYQFTGFKGGGFPFPVMFDRPILQL